MIKTIRILILAAVLGAFALPALLASKQHLCPVTGDILGGDTDAPVPVTEGSRTILFCCKSCVKKYKADPQKYAAGVQKAVSGR